MKYIKSKTIALLAIVTAQSLSAAIIVDNFSNTSLVWPQVADINDPWTFPNSDVVDGTLFGERRISVAVFNEPIGVTSIEYGISGGILSVTAAPESFGRVFLYHDSFFEGPFVNLEPLISAEGSIRFTFASTLLQDIEAFIVLQSNNGRMTLNSFFEAGDTQYFFELNDFNAADGDTFTDVFETRWFFDIPTGGSFHLSEIAIIPEPSKAAFLIIGAFALYMMLTSRVMQPLPAAVFDKLTPSLKNLPVCDFRPRG